MNQTHHMKPIAAGLASLGRNGDSMLVHMQPHEVAGLQQLAMAHGGSLTINPHTGLPEASFLGNVFKAVAPIALGFALGPAGLGLSSLQAGLAVGALGWAASGSLGKGVMAGLGGYGGAGLGGAIQGATPIVSNVTPVSTLGEAAAAAPAAASGAAPAVGSSEFWNATKVANAVPEVATKVPFGADTLWRTGIDNTANTIAAAPSTGATPMEAAWGVSRNSPTLSAGWQAVKADPMAFIKNNPGAAFTAVSPLLSAAATPPEYKPPAKEKETPYEGPYYPTERIASFPTEQERQQLGTKEYQYFTPTHPYPGYENYDPNYRGYAEGGDVNETPDPGSDPRQDAQEAMQYGIGGIAHFAKGGDAGGPGMYVDPNSIPSAAFQADLDAYNKRVKDLTQPSMPYGSMSIFDPNYSIYNRGFFNSGLTRAQAEAKAGPKPVWQAPPATTAPSAPPPEAMANPNFSGTGITSLPPRQPAQNLNLTGGFSDMSRDIINSGGAFAKGGYLDGPGDGMSDSIPATIANKQPARLADGEFVVPADVVSHLGNGSTKAGAQRLYSMMDKVRKARTGTTKQGRQINPNKYMPA